VGTILTEKVGEIEMFNEFFFVFLNGLYMVIWLIKWTLTFF
jgi:hypothetical protein